MGIAQIASGQACLVGYFGGTERIVFYLTEESSRRARRHFGYQSQTGCPEILPNGLL